MVLSTVNLPVSDHNFDSTLLWQLNTTEEINM